MTAPCVGYNLAMPVDHSKPIGTESLPKEDWCSKCKKDVDEWNVFMEPDGEGGYEKIHRCPHCNKKSLKDAVRLVRFGLYGSDLRT